MGREEEKSDTKCQLVMQICNLSTACAHKPPFVDWYLVLQVDENAGLELLRKQYRKLVLQLHPDKNKHPKAEMAFKLVYEAYACLSNNGRRVKFNLERRNRQCKECNRMEHAAANIQGPFSPERMNSGKILRKLGDLRARFSEEALVIENCLNRISESKRANSSGNDCPIFSPADFLCHGYPHQKTRVCRNAENSLHPGRHNFQKLQARENYITGSSGRP